MATNNPIEISFTPILTADPKGRGYSGYLAEFPELFAQGVNEEDVVNNLLSSLSDIFKYRKQEALFQNAETQSKATRSITLVPVTQ